MPTRATPTVAREQALSMTPEELRAAAVAERAHERSAASDVFGADAAKRYEAASATWNSGTASKAQREAAGRIVLDMEAGLNDAQRNRLFGIGEGGFNADDLRMLANAANDFHPESLAQMDDADLANHIARAMTEKGVTGADATATRQAIVLRNTLMEAKRRGWGEQQIADAVAARARALLMDPNEIADLARRRVAELAQPTQPATGSTASVSPGLPVAAVEGVPPATVPAPVQTRVGPNSGPVVPQTVRTDKFGIEGAPGEALPGGNPELAHVEKVLSSLGIGTRRVRTFDDMRAAAQELGMRPDQLLAGAAARPISDAEVVATGNLINDAAALHAEAMAKVAAPGLTDAERVALQQQASGAERAIAEALKRRVKGGTEAGRAVAAFRILANRSMDPAYWYTVAQRRLGERPFTAEIKVQIDEAIAGGDRLGLAKVIGGLNRAGFVDKLSTLAKAFMLSNPGTDVRNLGGNAVYNAALALSDVPATALDRIVSIATGVRSKSLSLRQAGEAARGIGSGVQKAGEVMRHGDTVENVLAKYDFNQSVHFDNPVLEAFTQIVFRRLGAEDYLFREPLKFRAIAELAEVTAKNEGLRGDAFLSRVRDLIQTPTPKMIEAAESIAAERTFNQPSAIANWLGGLERAGTPGKAIGTLVVPFKRTPINVAKAVVDFSPFGIPKAALRYIGNTRAGADKMLTQRYFVEGLGQSMTGTALAGLGWSMYQQGLAVGGPPTKGDEKNVRRATGVPNYAVRVGDQWVSINNNAPMSNVFMMGVDAAQQFSEDKSLADKLTGSTFAMTKGLTEQTFLKGVKGASEAATDPGRMGGSWLEGVAGMVVPSIVGAVARGTDPLERRINSPGDAVAARIPGLRQNLEPQVMATGESRRQQTGVLGQLFSPVRLSPARMDRLSQAMQRAGYAPNVPVNREMRMAGTKFKLTEQQLTQYQREVGEAQTRAMLAEIETSESYASLSPEEQAVRLRAASDRAELRVRARWKVDLAMK